MKSRVPASLLALILLLTTSIVAPAQTTAQPAANTTAQDWQGLRNLKPGKKVLVETNIGTVEGKFISAVGSKLSLSDDGYTFSLEQRDIKRIYRLKSRWSRRMGARVGAGIGMVVGTFVGAGRMVRLEEAAGHVPSDADTAPVFAGFFLGTLTGAGVGALLGGKRKGELLYEAK